MSLQVDTVARSSDRRPALRLLLIPLAALIAVAPLIRFGCSCGHDFDFHLLNWMEAARQLSHGNLHPHWAFTPAFNAGEPRFVFYPPLSWMLGAMLGLLMTHLPRVSEGAAWNATPILFTWIALTLSGLTLYRFARLYTNSNAAMLAAILYLANPYMLFTAYERTAYAELLAAAWIPLLLHAILRDRITVPGLAVPVALLWLTNAPAAVMGCYTLALLGLMRVVAAYRADRSPVVAFQALAPSRPGTQEEARKILAGTGLGLSLASFYIIPAAYERRYVQIAMATISDLRIDHNFLFEHTGTSADAVVHDQVLHTASVIAVILLVTTLIALVANLAYRNSAQTTPTFPVTALAVLAVGIAFLQTPLSLPLWTHTPQAAFLQFPWRLLAILAVVMAIAVAAALSRIRINSQSSALCAILLAVLCSHSEFRAFRQPCDLEDTAPARLALFQAGNGTDPTDEYTPTDADNDALAANNPPDWLAASPGDPPPSGLAPGPAPAHFDVNAPRAEYLVLNLRAYPAWLVFLNHQADPNRARRTDGLLTLPIPAGTSNIELRYAHTSDQAIGDAVTFVALALLILSFRSNQRRQTPA